MSYFCRQWRLKRYQNNQQCHCVFHLHYISATRELSASLDGQHLRRQCHPTYSGMTLDHMLSYREHLRKNAGKLKNRNNLLMKLVISSWGISTSTVRSSVLALCYSAAEYCSPVWSRFAHSGQVDVQLNSTMRLMSSTLHSVAILATSWHKKLMYAFNWKLAQVANTYLVCYPTIRKPGFYLSQQQWSLLNRFRTEQGHYGACRRKWRLTDTDLCPCGETQTMSHTVESCPLTKLNGGLSRLHSADEDAVSWLTSYGSWNAYEKKNEILIVTYTRHTQHCHFHWPWVT